MRILQVIVDLDGGGIDRYVINNCTRIKDIQFEFVLVKREYDGIMEPFIKQMGYPIHKVSRLLPNPFKNYREIKTIMKSNHFDAVHVHLGYKGIVALLAAKKCGIKTRILHSHLANVPMGIFKNLIRKIVTHFSKKLATNLSSCGIEAAKWMWGEKDYNDGKVTILNNAIPTKDFSFDYEKRAIVRKELGLESQFVVGHVGRLSDQKNQLRLLRIFKELNRIEQNSYLVLVGDGDLEKKIIDTIGELCLKGKVLLLGVRDDISSLLNAFDVFVLPSLYEGLPFVLIEAQCNGLSIVSSDSVSSQVILTNRLKMLSLSESDLTWANTILSCPKDHDAKCFETVADAGYDLDTQAQLLRDYYFNCIFENGGSNSDD